MRYSDEFIDRLTAPGGPFETVATENGVLLYKNAPADMSQLLNSARQYGEREFIVEGKQRLSFDDFFVRADQLAWWLIHERGLKPGQHIALCMKNSAAWMISFAAILFAGGVAVLVNSRGTGDTMRAALDDSHCDFLLADETRLEKLREAGCETPALTSRAYPGGPKLDRACARNKTNLAAMFFTSGTTGRAKAAMLSHQALITGAMNTQLAMAVILEKMAKAYDTDVQTLRQHMPQSCALLVFPLFHTSGCNAVFLHGLSTGGKLVLMERWNADNAMALIEKEKITNMSGAPAMYWDLFQSERFGDFDLSSLSAVSVGGQALALNLLEQMKEKFPNAFIGGGYGMTETSGAVAQATGEAFLAKPAASGQILPMVEIRIMGEDEQELPNGETGEIWVKGATLMDGYFGREEATQEVLKHGWLKTGDVGFVDSEGFITIIDRKTDMIISGGENIYCAEVERALAKHPKVNQVISFGVPDDRLGEKLIAVIVNEDGMLDLDDITQFAHKNLPKYKWPAEIILQRERLALNAMGKIEKAKVRQTYLQGKSGA